jgi:cyanophycinase-like exopeptidase
VSGRIVIMGSGETAPTMVKVHRALIEHAGSGARAMLDTPFGFQANADDLTEKVREYFADSVGAPLEVARWRRRDEPVATRERSLALLQRCAFVFAGPGSPTYALGQWQDTGVPRALVDVVGRDGTIVLGSAAAVTVGSWSVPVYEIYKVGEEPRWVPGLDLLGQLTGIDAAVIPHYDNREGGRHDTRFCYLGEQRLEAMEALLPDGVGILGVDEHTAVVIDVVHRTAAVHGAGGLTLRRGGISDVVPAGETVPLDDIAAVLSGRASGATARAHALADTGSEPVVDAEAGDLASAAISLRGAAVGLRSRFDEALAAGDAEAALAACLELEDAIHAWSADTLQSDDVDVARSTLRSMLVDLAASAVRGLQDPRAILGPVVEVALDARRRAREARDYATSDAIRDGLAAAGIEVRDTPDGMTWEPSAPGS